MNNRSGKRIRNNRIRRKIELRRKCLIAAMTACLIMIFSVGINGFLSNAKDNDDQVSYKYYTSITVSHKDTLWSIAETYMDPEHYHSINDYIQEVKSVNHLRCDVITYGEHLVVPYYRDVYME
ncbi:MAG: LysM peptidoglycan-binding domain-containing protein [Blautia sp.]|nr:LysM peptidoglycan-binding domain-containing protein [Blautia sp.]